MGRNEEGCGEEWRRMLGGMENEVKGMEKEMGSDGEGCGEE